MGGKGLDVLWPLARQGKRQKAKVKRKLEERSEKVIRTLTVTSSLSLSTSSCPLSFVLPYFFFVAVAAVIAAPLVGETGTIRCAYGEPFHITQGPPFFGSVG